MTAPGHMRPSRPADIPLVADNLRPADLMELQATGSKPRESLLAGLLASKPCLTNCLADGTPVAMWGVCPDGQRIGRIWLLGTELMTNRIEHLPGAKAFFLRESRRAVSAMFNDYDLLWNCVDARNEVHIRWIRWMGFTFLAEHPNYGASGRRFLEFCKVRS